MSCSPTQECPQVVRSIGELDQEVENLVQRAERTRKFTYSVRLAGLTAPLYQEILGVIFDLDVSVSPTEGYLDARAQRIAAFLHDTGLPQNLIREERIHEQRRAVQGCAQCLRDYRNTLKQFIAPPDGWDCMRQRSFSQPVLSAKYLATYAGHSTPEDVEVPSTHSVSEHNSQSL